MRKNISINRHVFMIRVLLLILCSLFASGCKQGQTAVELPEQKFKSSVSDVATPWTHLDFTDANKTVQFAVVADVTGGERPGVFEASIKKVNLLQPDFVITVGDLIEGYTSSETQLNEEWNKIDNILSQLDMPFFYAGGNHDLGDNASLKVWQKRYGRTYYHFVYNDVLFLILNTEDPPLGQPEWLASGMREINGLSSTAPEKIPAVVARLKGEARRALLSGEEFLSAISEEQVSYFQDVLQQYENVRWTFVIAHRPAWQASGPNPQFQQIENLLQGRNYTMIAGHAHTYSHEERFGMDYIRVSTTGGGWILDSPNNYDHVLWVTLKDEKPMIANILMDGVLFADGNVESE